METEKDTLHVVNADNGPGTHSESAKQQTRRSEPRGATADPLSADADNGRLLTMPEQISAELDRLAEARRGDYAARQQRLRETRTALAVRRAASKRLQHARRLATAPFRHRGGPIMIPAPPGWYAAYRHEDPSHHTYKPIVAWDEDGYPLVVGEKISRLCRADHWRNFDGTTDEAPRPPLVSMIPAGGWRVEITAQAAGAKWSEPLVGWGLRASGIVTPLTTDANGDVEEIDWTGDKYRIYHPDSTSPTAEEATGS